MTDRIYIVTDRCTAGERFWPCLEAVVTAGFSFIQLREKDLSADELYRTGERIMGMAAGVKLVVNDRIDVALALGAFGVQLTEQSMTPDVAGKIRGPLKVGLSVHTGARLAEYERLCDFFVFGNVFETASKPGVPGKSAVALRDITSLTTKPVYAIGGITAANAGQVVAAGAAGVALIRSVFTAAEPVAELMRIKKVIEEHMHEKA